MVAEVGFVAPKLEGRRRKNSEGDLIRYTSKDDAVYAICLSWPGDELILESPEPGKNTKVTILGLDKQLTWRYDKDKLHIEVPQLSIDQMPCEHAYVFKLINIK